MNRDLLESFDDFDESVAKEEILIPAEMGANIDGNRVVIVANRPSFVYVRLRANLSELVQAYNDKVTPAYKLPVLLKREGNRYVVAGRDGTRYTDWSEDPFLPRHAPSHIFDKEGGNVGGDPVWVYPYQFMPSLVAPFGKYGAENVYIQPYSINLQNDWKYVGNTGTISLTQFNPTGGCLVLLISMDAVTGNPFYLSSSGTFIADSITGTSQLLNYLPDIQTSRYIPLAFVRLVSGTSSVKWSNIYDVRQFLHTLPTGTSGGGGSTIFVQDEGGPPSVVDTFNYVGAGVDVSVSGTVARVYITGSITQHNDLLGIQGGGIGSYFHLNGNQVSGLVSGTFTSLHFHSGTASDVIFNIDGAVTSITGAALSYLITRPTTIESWYLYAENGGIASGTNIVDINLSRTGTTQTIFTNQSNRPMLLWNDPDKYVISGIPGIINFLEGDVLYPDVDQIATGTRAWSIIGKISGIGGGSAAFTPADIPVLSATPTGTTTATSASYADVEGANMQVTLVKRYADTAILIEVAVSQFSTSTSTTVQYGVSENSIDYDVDYFFINPANTHQKTYGKRRITGLPVGSHTFRLRWKRPGGAGTLTINADDRVYISVQEVQA